MTQVPTYEYRRFTRVHVSVPATIIVANGDLVQARIVELSFCGLSLVADASITRETACTVSFDYDEDKEVEVTTVIVSAHGNIINMEILGIRNDTFDYLRELVVANTEEPGRIDTEVVERFDRLPERY